MCKEPNSNHTISRDIKITFTCTHLHTWVIICICADLHRCKFGCVNASTYVTNYTHIFQTICTKGGPHATSKYTVAHVRKICIYVYLFTSVNVGQRIASMDWYGKSEHSNSIVQSFDTCTWKKWYKTWNKFKQILTREKIKLLQVVHITCMISMNIFYILFFKRLSNNSINMIYY